MTADQPQRKPVLPPKAADSGKDPMIDAPPTTPAASPTSGQKKQLTVWIDAELHKRMSRRKVEDGVNLQAQIEQAVTDYLTRLGY